MTDPVEPGRVLTLSEAVDGGDYLEILKAQRRDIVDCLPDEKGPAKAALHRQLALISKEVEEIRAARMDDESSVVDESDDEAWDDSAL